MEETGRAVTDYQCTAKLSHRNGLYYKTVALLRDSPAILFYTLGYIRYIHITSHHMCRLPRVHYHRTRKVKMYRAGLPDCLTEKKQDNIRLRHPKPHQPPSRHCHCHLQLYRVVIRRNLFFAVTKLHQKRSDHNGNGEYAAFEDSSLLE